MMKIDADVKEMSVPELRQEIMCLRKAFRKELDHTGDHRCWINLLKALPEGKAIKPLALSRDEFLGHCARYHARNQ